METISLFINNSKESKLAEKLLKEHGIDFIRKDGGKRGVIDSIGYKGLFKKPDSYPVFANSLKEPLVPSLFYEKLGDKQAYISFSGVKAYLRHQFAKDFPNLGLPWSDIETFYARAKNVTCFNEDGEKIFEGSIDKAPHNFKKILDRHNFSDWYKVGSRDLGNLKEICTKINNKGVILDPKKNLVLFSEDIDTLKKEEPIVLDDTRSIYHVSFGALYTNKENLFRLTAYMLD